MSCTPDQHMQLTKKRKLTLCGQRQCLVKGGAHQLEVRGSTAHLSQVNIKQPKTNFSGKFYSICLTSCEAWQYQIYVTGEHGWNLVLFPGSLLTMTKTTVGHKAKDEYGEGRGESLGTRLDGTSVNFTFTASLYNRHQQQKERVYSHLRTSEMSSHHTHHLLYDQQI